MVKIFGARDMKRSAPEVEFPSHVRGTGAGERMVGVLVGHRIKRRGLAPPLVPRLGVEERLDARGMGWSKRAGANTMRVRLRALGLQN